MAQIEFLEIISASFKSARTKYKVILQQGEDIVDGGNDLAYQAPSTFVTIGGILLQRSDIQINFTDKQCNQFDAFVSYVVKQKSTNNTEDGGMWQFPQVDQVMSVSTSIQSTTCYDIAYVPGGTITNSGTFGAAAGYSQNGFEVDASKTIVTIVKRVSSVPANWSQIQAQKIGKINDAILFNYPIGSLKFIGLDVPPFPIGGTASNQLITYQYEYREPSDSFVINGITIPAKKGWEVYDFKKQPDEYGNKITVDYQILHPYPEQNINCLGGSGQLFPQPL